LTVTPTFALDADVFITAYRVYYSFDLAPGFWISLLAAARNGQVVSIRGFGEFKGVKEELEQEDDPLAKWVKTEFSEWFLPLDEDPVMSAYRDIMEWVNSQAQYKDAAKAKFASGADGWLVASSFVRNHTVVTLETPSPQSQKNVKIPDVCHNFGVLSVDTFTMMRQLGIRLR